MHPLFIAPQRLLEFGICSGITWVGHHPLRLCRRPTRDLALAMFAAADVSTSAAVLMRIVGESVASPARDSADHNGFWAGRQSDSSSLTLASGLPAARTVYHADLLCYLRLGRPYLPFLLRSCQRAGRTHHLCGHSGTFQVIAHHGDDDWIMPSAITRVNCFAPCVYRSVTQIGGALRPR